MLEISDDALQLLKIFAQNADGNSRWADADFAKIYGQPSPDIEAAIEELLRAKYIELSEQPMGRRKTDLYAVTNEGIRFLGKAINKAS